MNESVTASQLPRSESRSIELGSWLPWFAIPLAIAVVADLWSKHVLFSRYPENSRVSWWGELTYNTGVAWGLGHAWPGAVLVLTMFLVPVLGWVWWRHYRQAGRLANSAFGLVLGGAIGNGSDRCLTWLLGPDGGYKGVRDFIRIDLNMIGIPYVWPNFNLADAAISLGFIALLIMSFMPVKPGTSR
jgi:lipoprotein signal peptidase